MKSKYIICENKAERDAVLRKLEKQGYVWVGEGEKPTEWNYSGWEDDETIYFNLSHSTRKISWGNVSSRYFSDDPEKLKITAQKFLSNDRPILITRKGCVVTAEDKNTGEKAIATCSPTDTFDFGTGAMIAVARLIANSDKGITKDAETVLRQLLGYDAETPADAPAEEEPITKFKVDDLVTLKDGLKVNGMYGEINLLENMYKNGYGKPMRVINTTECDDGDIAYDCIPVCDRTSYSYWYAEEMLELWDESKIREGDIVKVIHPGLNYSTYPQWVGEHISDPDMAARYCFGSPSADGNYKVIKIAEHESNGRTLAYIEQCERFPFKRCYLVEVKGLEKVTE